MQRLPIHDVIDSLTSMRATKVAMVPRLFDATELIYLRIFRHVQVNLIGMDDVGSDRIRRRIERIERPTVIRRYPPRNHLFDISDELNAVGSTVERCDSMLTGSLDPSEYLLPLHRAVRPAVSNHVNSRTMQQPVVGFRRNIRVNNTRRSAEC